MKNKLAYVLMVAVTISLSIISCKKKNPVEPTPTPIANCETSYEVIYGDERPTGEVATVSYENGQIKSLNSLSNKLNYEYSADKVTITTLGTPYYRIDIVNKLASKITDLTSPSEDRLTYDGNRNLIKIESYYDGKLVDTKVLTYANGNLNTLTQTFVDSPDVKKVTTFSYSSQVAGNVDYEAQNLLFGNANPFIPTFLLGNLSKNVLTQSSYTYSSGDFRSDITKTYEYLKNNNGTTNKIIENSHSVAFGNGTQTQDERLKRNILINSTCN